MLRCLLVLSAQLLVLQEATLLRQAQRHAVLAQLVPTALKRDYRKQESPVQLVIPALLGQAAMQGLVVLQGVLVLLVLQRLPAVLLANTAKEVASQHQAETVWPVTSVLEAHQDQIHEMTQQEHAAQKEPIVQKGPAHQPNALQEHIPKCSEHHLPRSAWPAHLDSPAPLLGCQVRAQTVQLASIVVEQPSPRALLDAIAQLEKPLS